MFYLLPLVFSVALYCAIVHRSVLASIALAGLVVEALMPAGKVSPTPALTCVSEPSFIDDLLVSYLQANRLFMCQIGIADVSGLKGEGECKTSFAC